MRKIISACILSVFVWCTLLPIDSAIAADNSLVVGFEIIAPTTARVNEAIDVTVRAIDSDKKTVTKYNGSILFISDTFGDIVPSQGRSISFTAEDAGQKKFSKGITFRSAGKQKIYVADVDNSTEIIWEMTVIVEPADPNTSTSTETITVVTPANNTKIVEDSIVVSGKTKKNSKVSILLNGQDKGNAISDDWGLFTKTLSGITQEKNILQVHLLDGTNAKIAQSEEIVFDRATSTQWFYNIRITPGTTVEASSQIQVSVEGDPGMASSSITIDSSVIALTQTQDGIYVADTVAPLAPWSYPIDVLLQSTNGQSIQKKAATTLIVTPKKPDIVENPTFSDVKAVTTWKRVTFTFSVKNAPTDLHAFKIAYGESADSLSEEKTTFPASQIQSTGGIYTWYIDNLLPKNYTFKIFWLKADATTIQELVSDPLVANIAIPACTIWNVGDITVMTEPGKSILSWPSLSWALSYNIYKVSPAWDQILVQNVTNTQYTIHHTQWQIVYSDFVIKALCQENVESVDMSKASKVQTWPWAIIFLVIISWLMGILILRKKSLS